MAPDPDSRELTVISLHPGVPREKIEAECGWPLKFSREAGETPAPTPDELAVLRALHARTDAAHASDA